jgi:hypothetical protein
MQMRLVSAHESSVASAVRPIVWKCRTFLLLFLFLRPNVLSSISFSALFVSVFLFAFAFGGIIVSYTASGQYKEKLTLRRY